MKKAGIALFCAWLFCSIASAATIKILWSQPVAELPYVKEFVIYMGDSKDVVVETQRLPYTGSNTLQATQTIDVQPGQTVKKYIAVSAVSKNGKETAKSFGKTSAGLDYIEITAPYPDVTAPIEVLLEIILQ